MHWLSFIRIFFSAFILIFITNTNKIWVARVTQPNAATYLSASLPIDTRTSENATGSCKFKVIPCKKEKKTNSEIKKEAAKSVTTTKKANQTDVADKKIWSVNEISKLKPHQFDKYEKEIMQARREGRIKA